MPTIKDVADHAGVSIATVSRLFSKPSAISASTRQRVQKSVDALGYEPDSRAKSLRTARVSKILVTVPDISNPFFASVIRGAEDAAGQAGYSVVLGDTRYNEEREEQYAVMLKRREVDGLVFLGHSLPPGLSAMLKKDPNAPIVNGCEYNPEYLVTSVHIDNRRAAMEAMEYLYMLGHRDVGTVTGPLVSPISRDRIDGVRAAADAAGAAKQLRIVVGDFTISTAEREVRTLLTSGKRPTALFCFSDEMAMGALSAICSCNLKCPDDVSLVGFDDIRFARYTQPSLTTVSQPMEAIGRETVRLLLDILSGESDSRISITLPHQLVIRNSTAARRGSCPT